MKTWATLKSEIRNQIWIQQEPENLKDSAVPGVLSAHDQHFQEGAADISKFIRCEQVNAVDVVKFCNTFFKCGMTITGMPNGKILRLSTALLTEDGKDYCSAITYREVEWPDPECLGKEAIAAVATLPDIADQLALGFTRSTDGTDNPCGRSRAGIWAKYRGNIYVAPWIQSDEFLIIEWDGIKKVWTDADLVNEEQDYKQTLQLYCQFAHERDYGNPEKSGYFRQLYDKSYAELMWSCEEKLKVRETSICLPCAIPGLAAAASGGGGGETDTGVSRNSIDYAGPPVSVPPNIDPIVVDSEGRLWLYWGGEWH